MQTISQSVDAITNPLNIVLPREDHNLHLASSYTVVRGRSIHTSSRGRIYCPYHDTNTGRSPMPCSVAIINQSTKHDKHNAKKTRPVLLGNRTLSWHAQSHQTPPSCFYLPRLCTTKQETQIAVVASLPKLSHRPTYTQPLLPPDTEGCCCAIRAVANAPRDTGH